MPRPSRYANLRAPQDCAIRKFLRHNEIETSQPQLFEISRAARYLGELLAKHSPGLRRAPLCQHSHRADLAELLRSLGQFVQAAPSAAKRPHTKQPALAESAEQITELSEDLAYTVSISHRAQPVARLCEVLTGYATAHQVELGARTLGGG